jgi:hypothetical protein
MKAVEEEKINAEFRTKHCCKTGEITKTLHGNEGSYITYIFLGLLVGPRLN